ncbi:MAG: alkaline phosphatase D family protein [Actinomycetota bacterium]|nr:alkaline phosphatase D family protein [Actinomycetota bacterium]
MLATIVEFGVALVAILLGAAFFTNAVEILGARLGLQQGAVGSLLATVGTALPESMIEVVAIMEPVFTGGATEEGAEIGVGAILGAPFMLATLALFVVGASALVHGRRRSRGRTLDIDEETIARDVGYFLIFFALAASVGMVDLPFAVKVLVAVVLVAGYVRYARLTLGSRGPPVSCTMAPSWSAHTPLRKPVPDLVLGPLLRHAGPTDATVWVETDAACDVGVLGCFSPTFCVAGHHYALVHVTGLEPGEAGEYEVHLDGEKVWPEPDSPLPPSVIRAPGSAEEVKLVFGSCRICAPHEPPYTLSHEEDERGLGVDALYAMAMRLKDEPVEELPHALVLLGDQIYAHKPPFDTLEFIRERRDTQNPPGEVVADFEEYARLYRDAWGDPAIRWLLSTVPSAMIFDDHEVGDDWNISASWVEEIRHQPWWNDQIVGGYASYWIYQHVGNLLPEDLDKDDLYAEVLGSDDAWPILSDFAYRTHRGPDGTRWSYHRDFGNTRLLVVDARGGRILEEGSRAMVDADELHWIEERATGGFDHLLLGTSLPLLLGPGMHHLQAWTERLSRGAWGARFASWAEGFRRSEDLDHWASFHDSFAAMTGLIQAVASGRRGDPPATILVLSGDIHHGYLAEAEFTAATQSRVYQAVCSPLRNSLPGEKSRLQSRAWTVPAAFAGRLLASLAGVEDEPLTWRLTHDAPLFDNQVATLHLEGRRARITFEGTVLDGGEPGLRKLYSRRLS